MVTATAPAPGRVSLPGTGAYPNDMDILTKPADFPADVSKIPDDAIISLSGWAHLQGVKLATVHRYRTLSEQRRRAGASKAGDMPAESGKLGAAPYWTVGQFREWAAARPGKGKGGGRRPGGKRVKRIRFARLPITVTCPCGCGHEFRITETDVREGRVVTGKGERGGEQAG